MAFAAVGQRLEWLWMDLNDIQWQLIKRFIPDDPVRPDRRGRPWADQRRVLNGILWILRTGAPWKDLPKRYGAYQTVHRRFTRWRKEGIIRTVLQGLAEDLHKRGGFDLSERFIDGSFAPAKKRGTCVGKTRRGKGSKIMVIGDAAGLPISIHTEAASPGEVTLVQETLPQRLVPELPLRLVADRAYGSDKLRKQLLFEPEILPADCPASQGT